MTHSRGIYLPVRGQRKDKKRRNDRNTTLSMKKDERERVKERKNQRIKDRKREKKRERERERDVDMQIRLKIKTCCKSRQPIQSGQLERRRI